MESNRALAFEIDLARRGIERGEEPRVSLDIRVSHQVEQGGLPGARVADQRRRRNHQLAPRLVLHRPLLDHILKLVLEDRYPVPHAAAVGFELGLAGSARGKASAASASDSGHLSSPAR